MDTILTRPLAGKVPLSKSCFHHSWEFQYFFIFISGKGLQSLLRLDGQGHSQPFLDEVKFLAT